MNFRTLFILNRIVAPIAVALLGASLLLPGGSAKTAIQISIGVPFAAVCLYGAQLGVRLKRSHFVPMRCPLCGRTGDAGRGLTREEVGWWFRCDSCGIVRPQGVFGWSFRKEPLGDWGNPGQAAENGMLRPVHMRSIGRGVFVCFVGLMFVVLGFYWIAQQEFRFGRGSSTVVTPESHPVFFWAWLLGQIAVGCFVVYRGTASIRSLVTRLR